MAYDWDNLLFSCQWCNERFKANQFPLRRPRRRARSHRASLAQEEPLLIHPAQVDPARHIGFRAEVAYPIRGNKVGKISIDAFGINRAELIEARRAYLETINLARRLALLLRNKQRSGPLSPDEAQLLTDTEHALSRRQADEAEYASMARCFLR